MKKLLLLALLATSQLFSQGKPTAKIQIDYDGDGIYEKTVIVDLTDPVPPPIPIPIPPPEPIPEPHPDPAPPPGDIPTGITIHHHMGTPPEETIPILGRNYTDFVAQAGPWNAPQTWADGSAPTEADRVFIQAGAVVSIEDQTAAADTVIVAGKLSVAPLKNTKFRFSTLTVLPGGELILGTTDTPIAGVAEIIVRDTPANLTIDPLRYGTGILVFGSFIACGLQKTPFMRLSGELAANATAVSLVESADGWNVGDRIELPDTRQLNFNERDGTQFKPQWEESTIQALSTDRKTVMLSAPLKWAHKGCRDVDGVLELLPHLANLTRNVTIRSENAASAWTGHILATDRAFVSLRNLCVREMGRTLNDPISPTNFIARYPLHLHHLIGPENLTLGTPQFLIQGCVIDGGTAAHKRKWGIVVHSSHYGRVKDNVVYNTMGAGIMTESGNETEDLFEGNLITRVFGRGGRADGMGDLSKGIGHEGAGIYLKSPFCRTRGNFAANVYASQPYAYGYTISFVFLDKVPIPTGPGLDQMLPGNSILVDANQSGQLLEFSNNETYASRGGMTLWWAGSYGNVARPGPRPTVIKDFRSWHCYEFGSLFQYEVSNCIFDGLWCRGDLAVTKSGNGAGVFYGMDYPAPGLVIRNADIQGQAWAWQCSTYCGAGQTQTLENSRIRCRTGIVSSTPWSSASSAKNLPKNHVVIRNCLFTSLPGENLKAIDRQYATPNPSARATNYIVEDTFEVQDFQQKPGDNFFVYYTQQDPAFPVPLSAGTVIGVPESGLSNSAALAKYGVSTGGKIAPCSTRRPEIVGFVCPN